ncbi:uncharacterized protein si:ch211-199g17.2 isoform X2 [Syngnathoides biaculeatus]|uniref:uncharacterized protein si:ch211-199g17.2 isoform X2 n=1 Tax=Syngnathoides biaculeatus TaxID=300417 RepID=UPI002ADDD802|nr:uncharacterized protein si:ch211-199g17.2 isoform X2 [Syngnathoides biaculeatus]
MQRGTQGGQSSELFESLKVYLNNSKRLQPIIGLRSVTECVKVGPRGGGEAVYLCEVCGCRLSKGDMRNHIMGSLHRYNYTKAWHPHMLSGIVQSGGDDVSLLAWPLMDIAKTLEDKEGPGDIKLLEVEDAAFETLKRASDGDAISLVKFLMYGPAEPEEEEGDPTVITVGPAESLSSDGNGASRAVEVPPSFGHALLDRYAGVQIFIGLFRVTECVGEKDGRTHCFLCHCCRTRVNTRGFIRHVGGPAHTHSYLMETRREQLGAAGADDGDPGRLMDSLVRNVEREEGRGGMEVGEVLKAPQHLCKQLASKSYTWCIGRLWKRCYPTVRKRNKAKKGSRVKKPAKLVGEGETQVVFKVSLPLTDGPLLLERTSFGQGNPPAGPRPGDDGDNVTAACSFAPSPQHGVEGVNPESCEEWCVPVRAPWDDWSPAPVEYRGNSYPPEPPPPPPSDVPVPTEPRVPPVQFQTQHRSIPVIWKYRHPLRHSR